MANAHVELQDRITALHDDLTAGAIDNVLKALPTAPTMPPPLYAPKGDTTKRLVVGAAVVAACVAVGFALRRSKAA